MNNLLYPTDLICPYCKSTLFQSLFCIGICLDAFSCQKCNKLFFLNDDEILEESHYEED